MSDQPNRPQSEPLPAIGIPDGKPTPRPSHCSGASLLVDRESYRALERGGIRWETRSKDLPAEGKGPARVACAGVELTLTRGTQTYTYALCRECMTLENQFRAALAAKVQAP